MEAERKENDGKGRGEDVLLLSEYPSLFSSLWLIIFCSPSLLSLLSLRSPLPSSLRLLWILLVSVASTHLRGLQDSTGNGGRAAVHNGQSVVRT